MADSSAPRSGYALPVDPLNELGDPGAVFKVPAQLQFMRQLIDVIRVQFGKFISRDTAVGYFYLQSPGGKTFRVTVTDAGTLQVDNARIG